LVHSATDQRPRLRFRRALAREWREIGGLGRLALIGVVAAGALAIVLGFSITAAARGHLLDARAEILATITSDLESVYEIPLPAERVPAFDDAVRERLIGGETVRVKVWLLDGTVAYSDEEDLVGEVFDLSAAARQAFEGTRASQVSDLTEEAHADHRHLGSLIEFYLPFTRDGQVVTSVFEIEQRTDLLESALWRIERNVWLSIGGGLGVLGLFLGALALARARDLNRRRRQAERVLGDSLRAREQERLRIVGSLHDDVGQPLYRLLYGLEGTAARMPADDPLRAEVSGLAELVHQVDGTLRAELRMLHRGLLADLGLETAVTDLVSTVRDETDLDIELEVDIRREPDDVVRQAIFRAAAEALTNVRKHAQASSVRVGLRSDDDAVEVEVEDDGTGRKAPAGLGLTTTRERIETLGGVLQIDARAGRGTRFRASLPHLETGA
jgi:signal transduction histidine kinase